MKKISVLRVLKLFSVYFPLLSGFAASSQAQIISGTLTNGLIAHYKFEGNLADSSDQGNNLQDGFNAFSQGWTSYGTDRFGNSSSMLNLNYAYVQLISQSSLGISGNQNATLSLWVKPSSDVEGIWLAGFGSLAGPMSAYTLSLEETYPEPRVAGGMSVFNYLPSGFGGIYSDGVTGDFGQILSSWNHLTAVYSGSYSRIALYLNGQALSVSNSYLSPFHSDTMSFSNTPLVVGVQSNQDIAGNMKGAIDDVVVYNRALSSQEVAQLYATQSVPEPSTYALLLLSGAASLWALRRRKS